jgi:CRP/FNR family nitrogen fixation transcriptional regulator
MAMASLELIPNTVQAGNIQAGNMQAGNMQAGRTPAASFGAPVPLAEPGRARPAFPPGTHFTEGHVLDPLARAAILVDADRDAEIIAQGDLAEHCFQVVSGCVRTVRLLEDGRRQIAEFLFAGDVFGWETMGEYDFAAEAVGPVRLRRFRLGAIEERAVSDAGFARLLRRYSAAEMRAARSRLILLGRKTASERIASFLLEMDRRLGHERGLFALPMSRGDMADYLGLTIETVCRGLSELRRQGMIAVDRANIRILDRRALWLAGSDRLQ